MGSLLITKAINLATAAHERQVDKSGKPYIFHPISVAASLDSENEQIVAILHDVVEDTNVTFEDLLRAGFSEEIVDGVRGVTRIVTPNKETYRDFIKRAALNPISKKVKIADIKHNLSRMDTLSDPKVIEGLGERYRKALNFLENGDSNY